MRSLLFVTAALISTCSVSLRSFAQTEHSLDIILAPLTDDQHMVTGIHVEETIHGDSTASVEPFRMSAALDYVMLRDVAGRISSLQVIDQNGQVDFSVTNDASQSQSLTSYRHWEAKRPVVFPVQISYTAAVEPSSSHSGPPFGMRPAGGGVAGSGAGFLLLPDDAWTNAINLHWDLSHFGTAAIGAISAGEGDVHLSGKPSILKEQWMLAGPAQVFHEPGKIAFTGYVLGAPFDGALEIAWASKAYDYLNETFRYIQPPPPYPVFVRILNVPPYETGTTMGRGSGFLMHIDNSPTAVHKPNAIHIIMFHEMTHQWVGHNADDDSWFAEGMTSYFTLVLPLRGGLKSPSDFLTELNSMWDQYDNNPAKLWTESQIRAAGFGQEDIRILPYMRGAFYFAEVDAAIRKKSHGKRDLIQALFPLFQEREQGSPLTDTKWEQMLTRELGPSAVSVFEQTILHPSRSLEIPNDTFGPCFRWTAMSPQGHRQWQLAFRESDHECRNF